MAAMIQKELEFKLSIVELFNCQIVTLLYIDNLTAQQFSNLAIQQYILLSQILKFNNFFFSSHFISNEEHFPYTFQDHPEDY